MLTALPPELSGKNGLVPHNTARCPGTATQTPPDGSAPFRDTSGTLDCNPNAVLPGP